LLIGAAVIELVVANVALFSRAPLISVGLIGWVSSEFGIYRLGLWLIGYHGRADVSGP